VTFTYADIAGMIDHSLLQPVLTDADLEAGCRALAERGGTCVAATAGAEGALVLADGVATRVPAFEVDVVDTTGCGDAFSAGFLRGISLGRSPVDAAVLGCATAAQIAGGLGTDWGDYDLATVSALADQRSSSAT